MKKDMEDMCQEAEGKMYRGVVGPGCSWWDLAAEA